MFQKSAFSQELIIRSLYLSAKQAFSIILLITSTESGGWLSFGFLCPFKLSHWSLTLCPYFFVLVDLTPMLTTKNFSI